MKKVSRRITESEARILKELRKTSFALIDIVGFAQRFIKQEIDKFEDSEQGCSFLGNYLSSADNLLTILTKVEKN